MVCIKASDGERGPWALYCGGPPICTEDLDIMLGGGAGPAFAELNPNGMKPSRVDDGHRGRVQIRIGTRETFMTKMNRKTCLAKGGPTEESPVPAL